MISEDMALVREYARSNSEQAFATLVSRHVNLVYSVALRQVRDRYMAEEVTQTVFVILAGKAKSLSPKTILSGWLCRTARYVSADTLKIQRRRQFREQELQMQSTLNEPEPGVWTQIAPMLDEALNCLGEKEHDAVVLRFFDGKELKHVGAVMGTTEDAARMRVNRGLEKLRGFFTKKGVTLSASSIAGAIAANSVHAAPAKLAATIAAAALSGTAITTTAVITAAKTVAMTTLQKTIVTASVVVLIGAGIYEARQAALVRDQVQTLRQQQAPLTEQIQQLQHERDETARHLASLREENERLNRATAELLKLRAEVGALRSAAKELKQVETESALTAAKSWVEKVNVLKKWVEQRPEQQIPEFQYLHDYDWLDAVKSSDMVGDNAPRNAMWGLREAAKKQFAHEMSNALKRFVGEHNGDLPTDLSQLDAYFQQPMSDTILKSYKLLRTGKLADLPTNEWIVGEIGPPFDEHDSTSLLIGTDNWVKTLREK